MKKIILVSTLLVSSLLAGTSLGEKISVASAQETITQTPLNTNQQTHLQPNRQHNNSTQLITRVAPQNIQRTFKKDHHRYDKRYSTFNYDRHGYQNNDGYYYGYYDINGYFFNNIFFSYNRNYNYNDRRYRRGFFRHGHRHQRHYVHHTFNDWNRIHSYREPNVVVRGHYYDRAHYPRRHHNNHYRSNHNTRSHYNSHRHNAHRSPARMSVNRINPRNNSHRDDNNHRYTNRNNHNDNYRDNHNYRNDVRDNNRNQSRMITRHSSNGHKDSRHMDIGK